jgi:hypothetical protein
MSPRHSNSLVPQLREAELALKQALAEACVAKHPSRANTGELIRIHEVIQIAGNAAKLAITIRRRRRLQEDQHTERAIMADAEATASLGPGHRGFTDVRGITWDVFAVYPAGPALPQAQLREAFQQGWLCFESAVEKRRLGPIPRKWESLTDRELEQLSRAAEVAQSPRRRRGQEPEDTRTPGA